MEAAGAVCPPAAGYRNGGDGDAYVNDVGDGSYWSSTLNDSNLAYYLYFNSGIVRPAFSNNRLTAFAIRLVTDVK